MEQDLRTCPGCGAPSSEHPTCPYCGRTPDLTEEPNLDADDSLPQAAEHIETGAAQFRELLEPGTDPEHLLDQVPEEMRGVLAARLKAAKQADRPSFSEITASALREQGYVVSEDARGARLTANPGQSDDLSPSEVVKLAADLDGGVQPQTTLPICGNCQAASPVGEAHCQWCGAPFSDDQ